MYFINESNPANVAKLVACEMINITYGMTFYDKTGTLLKAPKPKHNAYVLDDIDYHVTPAQGIAAVRCDGAALAVSTLNTVISREFFARQHEIIARFPTMVKMTSGISGTTQYDVVQHTSVRAEAGTVTLEAFSYANSKKLHTVAPGTNFAWYIMCLDASNPIPISGVPCDASDIPLALSLSSIVADSTGIFLRKTGYRCIDWPYISDYRVHATGQIISETLNYHVQFGLLDEISKHYSNVIKPIGKSGSFGETARPIRFVKWEWLNAVVPLRGSITVVDQIKDELYSTSEDYMAAPTCFMTNYPIYEDCYAFDIYARNQTAFTPETECHATTNYALKNGRRVSKKINNVKCYAVLQMCDMEEPKTVLISPYYMHLSRNKDPVEEFEKLTGTQVVVYRTFCPVTCKTVINNSSASPALKKVMLSCNVGVRINETETSAFKTTGDTPVSLSPSIKFSQLLHHEQTNAIVGVVDTTEFVKWMIMA